jgi:hypothetical protein
MPETTAMTLTPDEVRSWSGPPLVLFVGIRPDGSIAHLAFPGWAAALGRPWVLHGVDLPADTPRAAYRELATAIRDNPCGRWTRCGRWPTAPASTGIGFPWHMCTADPTATH